MCNEQGIQAYPTLRIYPKVKIDLINKIKWKYFLFFQRDTYQGPREKDALIRYAMSFVSTNVIKFDDRMFRNLKIEDKKPWLVSFCREIDEGDCLDDDQVYKLAVMLVSSIFLSLKMIDFFVIIRIILYKWAVLIVMLIHMYVNN